MKNNKIEAINVVAIFLLLETIAFISFGLSNSIVVFSILGIVMVTLLAVVTIREINKSGTINALFFLIPLIIFGLISVLGGFSGLIDISDRIFIPFAFLSFAAIGYFAGSNKSFDMSKALLIIYGGLAAFVFIILIITMIQYTPFYTLIYDNAYTYYDGEVSPVPIGRTAFILSGFHSELVSIEYFSFFPSVLSSSVIALFFISPKKEKKKFILYTIYAGIGILTLILTPTKLTLLTDIILIIAIAVIILTGKKIIKYSILKWVLVAFLALLAIGLIVLIINAQVFWEWTSGFRNFIASNPFLDRLFNSNRFSSSYDLILKYAFASNTIFGFNILHSEVGISNSIFFDTIATSGIIGLIFLIAMFVFGFSNLSQYFKTHKDKLVDKLLIFGFITSFLLYSLINYDSQPYIYFSDYTPIYQNNLFLVVIFLFAYTFGEGKKEVKTINEIEVSKKEEATYEI